MDKTGESSQDMLVILPEDVLVEILARLPVKSLLRFKCVCKSWYYLILDVAFLSKHFIHYTNNPEIISPLLVVGQMRQWLQGNAFSLISFNELTDADRCGIPIRVDTSLLTDFRMTDETDLKNFTYQCHGLGIVCMRNLTNDDIALWNPLTKEFRILPEISEPICLSPVTRSFCPPDIFCGLGFDTSTDDYKLVHFGYQLYISDDPEEEPIIMYTLSSNSWKTLNLELNVWIWPQNQTATCINGAPWWLAIESKTFSGHLWGYTNDIITSFDVTSEVFRYYKLPECCQGFSLTYYSLFQLHKCVGLGLCPLDYLQAQGQCFDIWMMKEFGLEVTWTKMVSVNTSPTFDRLLGFWPCSDVLLLLQDSNKLLFYDVHTQKTDQLVLEVQRGLERYMVVMFSDSLVHIGGRIKL